MSWDTDKVKCIIEEYREKSILWDLRDPNYKDNRKKLKLWDELAMKFECSVKEAKEKVTNLERPTTGIESRRADPPKVISGC